ncbi:ACP S-malonyltransferase [Spirosoma utsteinense]|uniref:Malonyl CoA-acyl carrier protein transacylase n=1 Tax=Spirosoma utsteinense TaxID=2585773 RepID=A0ABR6W7B4_9BACT|nr:ACP S-malonyltransferase [Spirosoma utsteinense]MBC3784898.1 [acyl-carrier-protein] S-malonyltransferase [Spirosoma utsteinense]MBC3792459.1 [acyl-carrier-protein] S-malonyltransferase [Spirosoma utsteinense]
MNAYVFPGQGSQFRGMGQDLYQQSEQVRRLFDQANEVLGYDLTHIMFEGTDEDLKQTIYTQPAVFLHGVTLALTTDSFKPDMVAGHSLGELSALTAAGVLSFTDGLQLASVRATAMQRACELVPSSMAAVLGLSDAAIEEVCAGITEEIVVPANYNCPGQVVISGSVAGLQLAEERLKVAGAKRVVPLAVSGAFHSPFMEPAQTEFAEAVERMTFNAPRCFVYQNVDAQPATDPARIKANLIAQLTSPVRWTQSIEKMVTDGALSFTECGPGKVLQGLIKKISPSATISGI